MYDQGHIDYCRRDLIWLQVRTALPVLARLISTQDDEVLADACWALAYLSESADGRAVR